MKTQENLFSSNSYENENEKIKSYAYNTIFTLKSFVIFYFRTYTIVVYKKYGDREKTKVEILVKLSVLGFSPLKRFFFLIYVYPNAAL